MAIVFADAIAIAMVVIIEQKNDCKMPVYKN